MSQRPAFRYYVHPVRGGALSLLLFATTAQAALPPVNTWGYLEYQWGRETSEEQPPSTSQRVTVKVNAATYIWQPWIALLDGGLGLSWSQLDQDGSGQNGELITGNARLRLFPRSHFPFEAFLERNSSNLEGDRAGPDLVTTSYGFSQQYNPKDGGRYSFRYRHTTRTEEQAGTTLIGSKEDDDFFAVRLSRALGLHSFVLRSELEKTDKTSPDEELTRTLHLLTHRFRPDASLSVDNFVSINDSVYDRDSGESRFTVQQLNSVVFWRPKSEKPLLVTGTALVQGVDAGGSGAASETQSIILNGGATYRWSPSLMLRANAGITSTQTEGAEDIFTTSQRVGADYGPPGIPLGEFEYNWNTSGELGNRTGVEDENGNSGSVQEISASLGHSLTRSISLGEESSLNFAVGQHGSASEDTADSSQQTLTHTASAGWNQHRGSTSTLVRVSANDTRRFGDDKSVFQLVNLQASRNQQLSRLSSLSGNLTVQASRSQMEDDSESGNWTTLASIDVLYRHHRFLGVPRLEFSSELNFRSENLIPLFEKAQGENEREDRAWRNRLDYRIGRMEMSLRAHLNETDGQMNTVIYFQVRRNFGGM